MTEKPTPEDRALWQRRLAAQANNRAWTLAEALRRSPEEDEEMLQAANAAMYFWKIVGDAGNHAHAALLLAHVYALLKIPEQATRYLSKSLPYFMSRDCAPSEQAIVHAIASNVGSAEGNAEAHAKHYAQALTFVAQVTDPQELAMLDATMRVIPVPNR